MCIRDRILELKAKRTISLRSVRTVNGICHHLLPSALLNCFCAAANIPSPKMDFPIKYATRMDMTCLLYTSNSMDTMN